MLWVILFQFLLQFTCIQGANINTFSALAPKFIFPHSVYNLSVITEGRGGSFPSLFTATVESRGKSYGAQELKINGGSSGVLCISVANLMDDTYNLTITKETDNEAKFKEVVPIYLDKRNQSVLIQTDKSIYKPGELIQYRVLVLDRFLVPCKNKQDIQVKILDPQGNIIKIWKAKSNVHGFFSSDLKLSDEPNLGEWTIEAATGGHTATEQVSVMQYTLPKFKVVVTLPVYLTVNASRVIAAINASYTYGKGIKGQCTVTLAQKNSYYNDELQHLVSKTVSIDGTAIVDMGEVKGNKIIFEESSFYNEMEFEVTATVTDAITGQEMKGSNTVKMYQHSYKIEELNPPTSYQPGLPIKLSYRVSTQDGVPIADPKPDAVTVTHGFSYNIEDSTVQSPLPTNGTVTFTFMAPSNELISVTSVEVNYKELKQQFNLPQRSSSKSRIYIQVALISSADSGELELMLNATKKLRSINYVITGKGRILSSGKIPINTPTKEHVFKIPTPDQAAPEGKLIVYAVFPPNNEIVAANMIRFSVLSRQINQLNISLSDESREPGQNISLLINTTPNSLIAIRGVDQSVLLLKEDKDIIATTLDTLLLEIEQNRNSEFRYWGGSSTFQVFEEANLVIVTNGFLEKQQYDPVYYGGGAGIAMPMMAMEMAESDDAPQGRSREKSMSFAKNMGASAISNAGESEEVRLRKNFPETWLWKEACVTKDNSSFKIDEIVPDTLTSWIITGYSLNSDTGVGFSRPQTLTTFRPFFISLNLPYSVVRDEILNLQVLVHNYMGEKISAKITIENKGQEFKFVNRTKEKSDKIKKIKVKNGQVTSLKFSIIPQKIGTIMLSVKGVVTGKAGDALSQPLRVKPPGHKQTKNAAILIDFRKRSKSTKKFNLTAIFPEKRVEGGDSVKLSVIGDILGGPFANLGNLLEMPFGCGEQNMVNFAPDIFILKYLKSAGVLGPEVEAKAKTFLESGYQRELTYRHFDGSFSAFGISDQFGSTWLTAFVIRSFVAAKSFITIDESIISQGLDFLVQKQDPSGRFLEQGHVLNSDLQGGSSSEGLALTSYVLLAFLESVKNKSIKKHSKKSKKLKKPPMASTPSTSTIQDNYKDVIARGLQYISKTENLDLQDIYALNLLTFTLDRAKHAHRDKFFEVMMRLGSVSGDTMHWEATKNTNTKKSVFDNHLKPATVEMTAYALLTLTRRKKIEEGFKVVKWLLQQRNAAGGFLSTQDTVVGLSALARFATLSRAKKTALVINATWAGDNDKQKQVIRVYAENSITLQEFYLPPFTRAVDLTGKGTGTALAQLTWSYYVKDEIKSPAFTLNIEVEREHFKLRLKICTSLKPEIVHTNRSNMAVMEVNLPSGYSIDSDSLSKLTGIETMKRYEMAEGDTRLIIYFDTINQNKTCVHVIGQKIFSVGKLAASYIRVYDYYDLTRYGRAFYDVQELGAAPNECRDDCHLPCFCLANQFLNINKGNANEHNMKPMIDSAMQNRRKTSF